MTKPRTDGFTLIEMLTVIAIVGILLAATLPAVTNLMKSSSLSVASRQLSSTLSLARQHAITHHTTTRVVFPYNGTFGAGGTNRAPVYQSYAVLEYGAITNYLISINTTNYITTTNYVSKWESLPLGIVFMSSNPQPAITPPVPPALDDLLTGFMLFPTNWITTPFITLPNGTSATLAYIEFKPTGAATVLPGSSSSTLIVTEGLMENGIVRLISRTSSNTLANCATITVDSLLGRIKVERPE